jgi:Flp pilus assembly protein CpaB
VKKKSPPWAFIAAGVFFFIFAVLIFKYAQKEQQEKADAIAAQAAKDQQELADAKSKQVTVQETPTDMRSVLYATQPVEPGARISAAFFEKKLTPKDILPDAYTDGNDIVGWFAIRKIEKGDPLTPRNVGKSLPYMSQRISPGMRAISLPVFNADVNDTGGFIVDGDRVDLLYTVSSADEQYKLDTQTIMQNVNVLYVPGPQVKTEKTDGITPIAPPGDPVAVTFEVTPEQAQALVFLTNVKNGRFSMILRARKDNSEVKIKPFAASDYDMTNLSKVQRTVDRSVARVKELSDEIEAKEKENASAPATTNETTNPIPPTP